MSNRLANKFVADLSLDIDVQTQNHIKKGGYRNSEVF